MEKNFRYGINDMLAVKDLYLVCLVKGFVQENVYSNIKIK